MKALAGSGKWKILLRAEFLLPARSIDRVKFVVTAGPTREAIDPVRFEQSFVRKMGYATAEAAIESDHDVVFISGPVISCRPAREW